MDSSMVYIHPIPYIVNIDKGIVSFVECVVDVGWFSESISLKRLDLAQVNHHGTLAQVFGPMSNM